MEEANFLKQRKQLGRAKLKPVKDPIPQIKFQISKLSYKVIIQIKKFWKCFRENQNNNYSF